ncbi:hypothetical protein CK203_043967 [Vitis vinifera]|uniref:Reverse transcriptase RNase H-like domain-containing protein n=1 Tax=Vitis vinifera TaxID=29760 RepID=A0A438HTC5_VITVI|nr:hypothetical protein CK203_043967 [Vitis vinifera]
MELFHMTSVDEMLAMGMSQIDGIVQLKLASPFDLFRVFAIEVAEEIQTTLDLEFSKDAIVVDDLFEDTIASIEGASDFVDPPFSFDVLSRFVSYSNDVHDSSFMDLSIFQVKDEIQKQASVGFLSVVKYPKVIPFGMKNIGATYQRAATTISHDMMHCDVEEVLVVTSSLGVSYTKSSFVPILVSFRHSLGMHVRLRHYMTEYSVHLISRLNPLRYLFHKPTLIGRLMRWSYHAYLELMVGRFDDLRYTHLPKAHNQFGDVLATLTPMTDIPIDTVVCFLLIESRSVPIYCYLIDETELDDGLPWYHDIY